MNDSIKRTLQTIASNFTILAEELEQESANLNSRISLLENETQKNKDVLKEVAYKILDSLE